MMITPELFGAYLKCPTKCFLLAHGEPPTGNAYAEWVWKHNDSYRSAGVARLKDRVPREEWMESTQEPLDLKAGRWRLAVDFHAQARNLESRLQGLERLPAEGRAKTAQFVPIRFIFTNKLTKDDKLMLAFDALVLSEMLSSEVNVGKIVHGDDQTTVKAKTSVLLSEARKQTANIALLLSNSSPPDLVLNRHCVECDFQARCRLKATEKDDLSLLSNMSEKERTKFKAEGIFTVTQLSYTFRPRRRPKQSKEKREKYHHALKALAIRLKKIHIVGNPELKIQGTPVYLDVEGLPDREFYYLIGVRVMISGAVVQSSFWADEVQAEKALWGAFLNLLSGVEKPVLVHYGSFETTFLKRMVERYGAPSEGSRPAEALKSPLNLVSFLFAQIYFPCYSNRLKDVGPCLGFQWSSTGASGIDSIIWRMRWEQSHDSSLKQKLITYNSEDCRVLEILTGTLSRVCNRTSQIGPDDGMTPEVVLAESSTSSETLWPRFSSPIHDFELINKAARWDYQRERVYLRTDKSVKRAASTSKVHAKRATRINKSVF